MGLVMEGTRAVWKPPVNPDTIRRAPAGQLRIVRVDRWDSDWPWFEHDCASMEDVKGLLGQQVMGFYEFQRRQVYNDQGVQVFPYPNGRASA